MRLDDTSPSVQTHLGIIQGVIDRMATNATSCKTWCITVVSAILVVIADKDRPNLALLAVAPVFIFGALDVYYLALENGFRNSYDAFIAKLHAGKLLPSDLYSMRPSGKFKAKALKSFSVWAFYSSLLLVIAAAWWLVLPSSPGELGPAQKAASLQLEKESEHKAIGPGPGELIGPGS